MLTMNIVLNIPDFDEKNVFFLSPVKNTIMENSSFIRLIYSNDVLSLTNILIKIDFQMSGVEKSFNKYKYIFKIDKNKEIINKITTIETALLERLNIANKTKVARIATNLRLENVKLFTNDIPSIENQGHYILKISGIWETQYEYGLTYKYLELNQASVEK